MEDGTGNADVDTTQSVCGTDAEFCRFVCVAVLMPISLLEPE